MAEQEQGSAQRTLADGRELTVRWSAVSDVGQRREINQDAFMADFPMFAVADGMGGHLGGEIASRVTIDQLKSIVASGSVSADSLQQAIDRATKEILTHGDEIDDGTGTTLTGFYLAAAGEHDEPEEHWAVFNIGDSRVYLVREGAIAQVTTDHSVVQEMVSSGRISAEEAETHPYSNVITRAVGSSESTEPDWVLVDLKHNDMFVVCSDGLTKELTDFGIRHFLLEHKHDPKRAMTEMLKAALENGGRDNITLIVAHVGLADSSPTAKKA
jgi:serine/threonine protein phosphatase PrpC